MRKKCLLFFQRDSSNFPRLNFVHKMPVYSGGLVFADRCELDRICWLSKQLLQAQLYSTRSWSDLALIDYVSTTSKNRGICHLISGISYGDDISFNPSQMESSKWLSFKHVVPHWTYSFPLPFLPTFLLSDLLAFISAPTGFHD